MKGDFTRVTFDPAKHFSRVLMQQGRVTLDADYNEQTDILLHYLRKLARDLIGPYAAPNEDAGFKLRLDAADLDLWIGKGRYYVDGILVENDGCYYATQPDPPSSAKDGLLAEIKDKKDQAIWIYLDVWERHITAVEDDSIREKALNGPDTCTRAKVVWQVKAQPLPSQNESVSDTYRIAKAKAALEKRLIELNQENMDIGRKLDSPGLTDADKAALIAQRDLNIVKRTMVGAMQPQLEVETNADDILKSLKQLLLDVKNENSPKTTIEAKVNEIERHIRVLEETIPMTCDAPLALLSAVSKAWLAARVDPGQRTDNACVTPPDSKYRGVENQLYRVEIHDSGAAGTATFKWSRDNGSVAAAWLGTFGNDLKVSHTRGFKADNWVELFDDTRELQGLPGVLVKLKKVEGDTLFVDAGTAGIQWSSQLKNPKVRRWDQIENASTPLNHGVVPIKEGSDSTRLWINLEDGIQISFSKGGTYRTGDYWLIPARVATGKIEWPGSEQAPAARQPHGIEHHYAPLGFVSWKENKWNLESCGCVFEPQSSCFQALPEKVKTSPKPAPVRKRRSK